MPGDVPCSHCGREPSHPQARNRFVYAAHYRSDLAYSAQHAATSRPSAPRAGARTAEPERVARNRFPSRVRRRSGLAGNRGWAVRLLEHPAGATGGEGESDTGFRDGKAVSWSALVRASGKP